MKNICNCYKIVLHQEWQLLASSWKTGNAYRKDDCCSYKTVEASGTLLFPKVEWTACIFPIYSFSLGSWKTLDTIKSLGLKCKQSWALFCYCFLLRNAKLNMQNGMIASLNCSSTFRTQHPNFPQSFPSAFNLKQAHGKKLKVELEREFCLNNS